MTIGTKCALVAVQSNLVSVTVTDSFWINPIQDFIINGINNLSIQYTILNMQIRCVTQTAIYIYECGNDKTAYFFHLGLDKAK